MIYKRTNGKKSFFKNSYQEVAGYLIFGFISYSFAIKGLNQINTENEGLLSYVLITQLIIYSIYYIYKFKKYFYLKD